MSTIWLSEKLDFFILLPIFILLNVAKLGEDFINRVLIKLMEINLTSGQKIGEYYSFILKGLAKKFHHRFSQS